MRVAPSRPMGALSLLVTPVAYSLFNDAGHLAISRRVARGRAAVAEWVRGRVAALANGNGRIRNPR